MKHYPEDEAKWWKDRWWVTEEYSNSYQEHISPEQVDRCVTAVTRVFHQRWLRTTKPHPACFWLLSQGLNPLQFLISLGQNLLATRDAAGFREIVKDLREPGNYESARLELSLGALLSETGHSVQFHPSLQNGKTSDLAVRTLDQEVFFEVKILRESQINDFLGEFTTWLGITIDEMVKLHDGDLKEMNSLVELEPRIADIFSSKVKNGPNFGRSFAERTKMEIAQHLTGGHRDFCIPEVGHFRFQPKDILPNSTITHLPVNSIVELGRILRNRLHGAIDQLPSNRPGIIVIRTAGEVEPALSYVEIQSLLGKSGDLAAHVSGVVVLPVTYSFPQRWSRFAGFAVQNPCAKMPLDSLLAFRTLAHECQLTT
jgi:hypothetical protein